MELSYKQILVAIYMQSVQFLTYIQCCILCNPQSFLFCGKGTVIPMLEAVLSVVPIEKLAVHFHDTYGQSLPNILVSLQVRNPLQVQ